jgi:DNA-binding NtrC family response regulator
MDFNQSKADLLKQIAQQKHNQAMERRSIQAKDRMKEKAAQAGNLTEVSAEKTSKPSVAIFGSKSLFMVTLKNLLQQYCEIYEFDEVEKAGEFFLSNKVPLAVIDMDPPNDWKCAHNFFTTGKTINPDMQYIVYQKEEKLSEPVEILQKQGAIVLRKPIDRMELIDLVKKFTAEWREKNAVQSE